jgi:hypothetical protein
LAAQRVTAGAVALIGDVWLATLQLDLRRPREWGALKGSTSLKVEIGRARYDRPRDARRALNRAGRRLENVDPGYELVRCERRGGGWCLVVRRLAGARARAQARKQGMYRDPGIAAKKQQRQAEQAERLVVREIARRSLTQTTEAGGEAQLVA